MEKLKMDHIRDLVSQLDSAVTKEGAVLVHGVDEVIDSGFADDLNDWPEGHNLGLANQRGLLRFGIEHLKAALVEGEGQESLHKIEVNGEYLSDSCNSFVYVRNDSISPEEVVFPQLAESGKLFGGMMWLLVGFLIITVFVGLASIWDWVVNKVF